MDRLIEIKDGRIFDTEIFYLEYVNNYLTQDRMAKDYEMTIKECTSIVDAGKKINNKRK